MPGQTAFEARRASIIRSLGVDLIIDVGANVGQYAASVRSSGYTNRIISFEPISSAFASLSRAAASDSEWYALQYGLSSESRRAIINVAANNAESSSLLPMASRHSREAPYSAYVRQEEIELVTLDSFQHAALEDASRIWLKIDVQGHESSVLLGAKQILPKVEGVETELSLTTLYEEQELIEDSIRRMRALGFRLVAVDEVFTEQSAQYALQYAGVFVRE